MPVLVFLPVFLVRKQDGSSMMLKADSEASNHPLASPFKTRIP